MVAWLLSAVMSACASGQLSSALQLQVVASAPSAMRKRIQGGSIIVRVSGSGLFILGIDALVVDAPALGGSRWLGRPPQLGRYQRSSNQLRQALARVFEILRLIAGNLADD